MGSGDLGDGVGFWRAEAQRWRARAERSEAETERLRERVVELEGQVGALAEKVAELTRLAFGKSSEKQTARKTAEQTAEQASGEGGLDGTLAGVLAACSPLLAPLAAKISERNAAAAHLHVDETRWQVYAAVEGKDSHRWWLWVFAGPDTTVFTIAPSRSLKVLSTQLGITTDPDTGALPDILPGGRRLLLSSDFYTVYQSLGRMDGVDNLWCWSHIRRYFVRAGDAHPADLRAWTEGWLERIGALYRAHSALAAAAPGSPQHTQAVEQFDTALAAIDHERHAQTANAHLMHPAAVKVLATLDREWEGLARHREFPELPLDNNTSERALRGPVVGRKDFYGSGSRTSAELAGRAWTITATAQRAGLNPLAYLGAYLHACAEAGGTPPTGAALDRFLPWALNPDDRAAWARHPDTAGTDPPSEPARVA